MHSLLRSADGDQQCLLTPSTVADGVSRKTFLATYISTYLKNQYSFTCTLNSGFFTALLCRQTAAYFSLVSLPSEPEWSDAVCNRSLREGV